MGGLLPRLARSARAFPPPWSLAAGAVPGRLDPGGGSGYDRRMSRAPSGRPTGEAARAGGGASDGRDGGPGGREARLKAALKANIARRKAQARERAGDRTNDPGTGRRDDGRNDTAEQD